MATRGKREPFVHYARPLPTHGSHRPTRVILHGTQNRNVAGAGDVLAIPAFWRRQGLGYSSHLVMDAEGITCRCATDKAIVWATGGSNTGSLQVEIVSQVTDSAAAWERRDVGLKQLSKWLAYWHLQYGIPLARSVRAGVATHLDHSRAFGKTTHTDPGPAFPFEEVLRRARWYADNGWYAKPNA